MEEQLYLCRECRHVFRVPVTAPPAAAEIRCPKCGSGSTEARTAWVPQGTNLGEGSTEWDYRCQDCQHTFKRTVPKNPAEEQALTCPACQGHHIRRLTGMGGLPLYCGC